MKNHHCFFLGTDALYFICFERDLLFSFPLFALRISRNRRLAIYRKLRVCGWFCFLCRMVLLRSRLFTHSGFSHVFHLCQTFLFFWIILYYRRNKWRHEPFVVYIISGLFCHDLKDLYSSLDLKRLPMFTGKMFYYFPAEMEALNCIETNLCKSSITRGIINRVRKYAATTSTHQTCCLAELRSIITYGTSLQPLNPHPFLHKN